MFVCCIIAMLLRYRLFLIYCSNHLLSPTDNPVSDQSLSTDSWISMITNYWSIIAYYLVTNKMFCFVTFCSLFTNCLKMSLMFVSLFIQIRDEWIWELTKKWLSMALFKHSIVTKCDELISRLVEWKPFNLKMIVLYEYYCHPEWEIHFITGDISFFVSNSWQEYQISKLQSRPWIYQTDYLFFEGKTNK